MEFNFENHTDILSHVYNNNIDKDFETNPKFKQYNAEYFVPRVTVLLDTIKEDYLLQWANSLGWKRMSYSKTLQQYADIGTEVHNDIEDFIKYGEVGMSPGFISFKDWWDKFNELNVVTNVKSELNLSCPYFAGTTDLFFKANGKNCLVDFKTSKNISYKYTMQLSAYTYMIQEAIKEPVDYCIILQVDKYEPRVYDVYLYDLSNPDINDLFNTGLMYMICLSKGYHYRTHIEQKFSEINSTVKCKSGEVVLK